VLIFFKKTQGTLKRKERNEGKRKPHHHHHHREKEATRVRFEIITLATRYTLVKEEG